jgi:hypothetical protein
MASDQLFNYMDPALTNVSVGYKNRTFYSEMLAPPLPVEKPTGRIWLFGKEKFRLYETIRERKAEAREIAPWSLNQIPYMCQNHGLKDVLTDQDAATADPGVDWDINTTENLTQAIALRQEMDLMNAIINGTGPSAPATAVPSTTLSGTGQWSDYTNSDPIAAIEAQRAAIVKATGAKPNTLSVGYPVHLALRQHPRIIDRFKYTVLQNGYPSDQQLASVFEVDNYWVLDALYDTRAEGLAPSPDFIWGKNAVLAVVPASPQKREVALAYTPWWTFARTGEASSLRPDLAGNRGLIVRRYRVEAKRTDVLEIDKWYSQVFGDSAAGYVWKSAVA